MEGDRDTHTRVETSTEESSERREQRAEKQKPLNIAELKEMTIGGLAKANQPLWTAEVYESAHGAWRALPEMSTARGYLAVARGGPGTSSRGAREAASDREPTTVLALGGSDGARTLRSAEAFDFARGEWRSLAPMSAPRIWLGAATVGSRTYAVGG